jgi:hypothetical protein
MSNKKGKLIEIQYTTQKVHVVIKNYYVKYFIIQQQKQIY